MSLSFRRTRHGTVGRLEVTEVALLTELLDQLVALVAPEDPGETDPLARELGISDSVVRPSDPALARLLPDAYGSDPDKAAEFRRYTEFGLRERKVRDALAVRASLPPDGGMIRLDAAMVETWLRTLTDLRLALGVRLDVDESTEDLLEMLPEDDPRVPGLSVYSWLGWLQESLVRTLL